jgi:hypothetical protein
MDRFWNNLDQVRLNSKKTNGKQNNLKVIQQMVDFWI